MTKCFRAGGCAGSNYPFLTSKERDVETGLDYFGARYYGSTQGRFTSVDPIYVTLERLIDPQRLNLYSYVRNNPLVFVDPDGMDLLIDATSEEEARKKFALLQKGLTLADRKHTSFFVGDGKNGYENGKFYALVEKDYKSDSGNFQAIQAIANDRGERAFFAIVGPKDTFASQVGVKAKVSSSSPSRKFTDRTTTLAEKTLSQGKRCSRSGALHSRMLSIQPTITLTFTLQTMNLP